MQCCGADSAGEGVFGVGERLILRVGQSVEYCLSGDISRKYSSVHSCLELIENNTPPDEDIWISLYKAHLKDALYFYRLLQIIPTKLVKASWRNTVKELINNVIIEGQLICKEVVLPVYDSAADMALNIGTLFDGIGSYLLSDVSTDVLHNAIPIIQEGLYEYKAVKLNKGDIVIDAGANIGEFSAYAGIKGCRAYAFEPVPYIVDKYLSKTVEWNPNITICRYALSDNTGKKNFGVVGKGASSSSLDISLDSSEKIIVQAIDLDTFVEINNLPRVDFIKADIEGAERYMLMGAKRILKEFSPKLSICTYHLPDDPKVLRAIILDANPDYEIEERWKKMYAYVPKNSC